MKISVTSPAFEGETLPTWTSSIKDKPRELDVSAVLHVDATTKTRSLRVAVVNRDEKKAYRVPLRVAFEKVVGEVEVHELWHADVKARNGWGHENEVVVKTRSADWGGEWTFKEHSFTLLVLSLE